MANYADIKLSVMSWINRTDLNDSIPKFISFGQQALERVLRIRAMETYPAPSLLNKHSNRMPLPSDYKEMISISIIDPETNTRHDLLDRWPGAKMYDNAFASYDTNTFIINSSASGCTLNITAAAGIVTAATVVDSGTNYNIGDHLKIDGGVGGLVKIVTANNGAALTVAIVSAGTSGYTTTSPVTTSIPLVTELSTAVLGDIAIDSVANSAKSLKWGSAASYATLANWQSFAYSPGVPVLYFIKEDFATQTSMIYFDLYADKNYIVDMPYYSKQTVLSADNDTNYWSVNAESLFIYAALVEAIPFLKGEPAAAKWEEKFTLELARLKDEDKRERSSGQKRHWRSPNAFFNSGTGARGLHYDKFIAG